MRKFRECEENKNPCKTGPSRILKSELPPMNKVNHEQNSTSIQSKLTLSSHSSAYQETPELVMCYFLHRW